MDDKIKLVIASVLKPVDDSRAFNKIGRSLAQTNKYDVNIIGFESKKTAPNKNITFWHLPNVNRKHFRRFLAPFKILKIYHKVKPELIIVNTPELLPVTFLYRILFGVKIIYDIQENYQMNITYGRVYPHWQKPFIKAYLYIIEGVSKYFIAHYFLAEKVYLKQLSFLKKDKTTILENKAVTDLKRPVRNYKELNPESQLKFIITGTLGDTYGTLEGISYFNTQIKKHFKNASIHIIGFAAEKSFKRQLISLCEEHDSIKLSIENGPIAHSRIVKAIEEADLALLPYKIDDNLKDRIPTKIYEYMAYELPMVISKNHIWEEILYKYEAGLSIDFQEELHKSTAQAICNNAFYQSNSLKQIYWDSEEQKLLNTMEKFD